MNIYIDIYRGSKKSDNYYYYYRRSDTNNLRYLVYFCTYQNSTKYVLERGGNGRKPWGKSAIFCIEDEFSPGPPLYASDLTGGHCSFKERNIPTRGSTVRKYFAAKFFSQIFAPIRKLRSTKFLRSGNMKVQEEKSSNFAWNVYAK